MAMCEVQRRKEWGCNVSDVVAAGSCQGCEVSIRGNMKLIRKGGKEVDIVVLK